MRAGSGEVSRNTLRYFCHRLHLWYRHRYISIIIIIIAVLIITSVDSTHIFQHWFSSQHHQAIITFKGNDNFERVTKEYEKLWSHLSEATHSVPAIARYIICPPLLHYLPPLLLHCNALPLHYLPPANSSPYFWFWETATLFAVGKFPSLLFSHFWSTSRTIMSIERY